jgi:hypothetical protein
VATFGDDQLLAVLDLRQGRAKALAKLPYADLETIRGHMASIAYAWISI